MRKNRYQFMKTLLLIAMLGFIPLSSYPQESDWDRLDIKKAETILLFLYYKELCDVMVPGFESENYEAYLKWESKYHEYVVFVKKLPRYKEFLSSLYEQPNTVPDGEDLDEICTSVSEYYKKENLGID